MSGINEFCVHMSLMSYQAHNLWMRSSTSYSSPGRFHQQMLQNAKMGIGQKMSNIFLQTYKLNNECSSCGIQFINSSWDDEDICILKILIKIWIPMSRLSLRSMGLKGLRFLRNFLVWIMVACMIVSWHHNARLTGLPGVGHQVNFPTPSPTGCWCICVTVRQHLSGLVG